MLGLIKDLTDKKKRKIPSFKELSLVGLKASITLKDSLGMHTT